MSGVQLRPSRAAISWLPFPRGSPSTGRRTIGLRVGDVYPRDDLKDHARLQFVGTVYSVPQLERSRLHVVPQWEHHAAPTWPLKIAEGEALAALSVARADLLYRIWAADEGGAPAFVATYEATARFGDREERYRAAAVLVDGADGRPELRVQDFRISPPSLHLDPYGIPLSYTKSRDFTAWSDSDLSGETDYLPDWEERAEAARERLRAKPPRPCPATD